MESTICTAAVAESAKFSVGTVHVLLVGIQVCLVFFWCKVFGVYGHTFEVLNVD